MEQKPLFEISRRSITINKNEEPSISWQNSFLTARSQKRLNLLYFSRDLQCMDKQIDWCISSIPSPKSSPAMNLFSSKFKRRPMSNFEYQQMTMEPSLWPHNPLLLEDLTSIICCEWSPPDLIHNNESVLAVLTNAGNVELYGLKSCGFKSILNISSVIEKKYEETSNSLSADLKEFKKGVDAVVTLAMCWGDKHNGACSFVTAQKNGDVHFWKLKCEGEDVNIDLLITLDANGPDIVAMQWIPVLNNMFFIIIANDCGQLFVYKYEWEENNIKLVNMDCLWSHKDRFVVKHITSSVNGDNTVIVCEKDRHLLTMLVDGNCKKISECIYNVNDCKISSISENNGDFYITTIDSNVYKVTITVPDGSIQVTVTPILFKENFTNKELFGFQFSKNKVISALALVDRKIMYRKENVTVDIVFHCHEVDHGSEISCLLTNPTKRLTDYEDCIEMLRYKTMKLKTLPSIDYVKLYTIDFNDVNSLYKIKVYHILLTLYNNLEKILKNGSRGWLPETSLEAVREKILALHAGNLVTDLYTKTRSGGYLYGLEAESLVGTKKYLKYYCQKYNITPTDLVPSEVADLTDIDCKYICQCCDQAINGFSCANGHLNMFCALTLTPIESEQYLVCKGCGVVARFELLSEKPMCVFCDTYLNYYPLPS